MTLPNATLLNPTLLTAFVAAALTPDAQIGGVLAVVLVATQAELAVEVVVEALAELVALVEP